MKQEKKVLAGTYIHNVSVDDSGIYFWAADKGEFHCIDLDGVNDTIILHGGDFSIIAALTFTIWASEKIKTARAIR